MQFPTSNAKTDRESFKLRVGVSVPYGDDLRFRYRAMPSSRFSNKGKPSFWIAVDDKKTKKKSRL